MGLESIRRRENLPERTISALFDAAYGYRVRNVTYRAVAAQDEEISEQTASRDLKTLVEARLPESRGERRGRFYVAGAELSQMRQTILQARKLRDDRDPFRLPRKIASPQPLA